MDLKCNACWAVVTEEAVVCTCKHVFCAPCLRSRMRNECRCPICRLNLSQSGDIVQVDATPASAGSVYVAYGQAPDVVLKACSAAIDLWTFQRGLQDARRRELLQRERADNEQKIKELDRLVAENSRLREEQHDIASKLRDANERLGSALHSKRKLVELYSQLKEACQMGGGIPQHLLQGSDDRDVHGLPFEPPQKQHNGVRRIEPGEISGRPMGSPGGRSVSSPFARAAAATTTSSPSSPKSIAPPATTAIVVAHPTAPSSAVHMFARLSPSPSPRPSSLMDPPTGAMDAHAATLMFLPQRPATPRLLAGRKKM